MLTRFEPDPGPLSDRPVVFPRTEAPPAAFLRAEKPPLDSGSALSALYDRYFTVLPATTPDLLDAAHALRYQVYCVENAFEDPALHPGEREFDEHDSHSVHAVLIYIPTGQVVGCVRLILPEVHEGASTLPIRSLLNGGPRARFDQCDPTRTAEISRYAVSKMFRRRVSDNGYPDVHVTDLTAHDARRLLHHVSLGLMRGVVTLATSHPITTICAAMAPALVRMLERFGLVFDPLGPVIEHHGARQPSIVSCEELVAGMATRHSAYCEMIEAEYHWRRRAYGNASD